MPRTSGLSKAYQGVLCSLVRSKKLLRVSIEAEALYFRLLLVCDDSGRYPAEVGEMAIGPMAARMRTGSVTPAQCDAWLDELIGADLVRPYEVGGERYVELTSYENFRRYKKSEFPAPDGFQVQNGRPSL